MWKKLLHNTVWLKVFGGKRQYFSFGDIVSAWHAVLKAAVTENTNKKISFLFQLSFHWHVLCKSAIAQV